jgi:hypothetical protein
MPIRFELYGPQHAEAVRAFNARIAKVLPPEMHFPEQPLDWWLPAGGHPDIFQEAFLAMEDSDMRGGYFLKHQPFWIAGQVRRAASYRLPVSEGIVNRAYIGVAMQTLRDAVARQPLLFSLGMGSVDAPVARLEKAAGWSQYAVPFRFRVVRGGRFLRNIAALRSTPARRIAADLAALTGIGSLAFAALRVVRRPKSDSHITAEPFDCFKEWADELWERARSGYSIAAVRDSSIGNALYPASDKRFQRWKISRGAQVLGWAVGLTTQMRGHKQFGDLRVATIVDAFAAPGDAEHVIAAATKALEKDADLIVSNQMHDAWADALERCGFLKGPSNFIFSSAKELSRLLDPFAEQVRQGLMNRGDGDGPVHL